MSEKLTVKQKKFCEYYIQTGNATDSARKAGYSQRSAQAIGVENLSKPMIKQYINERMKPMEDKLIADSNEVMEFFTASMRGNVKDQFGLDPSLSDRISAAKELAKRTIDIESKKGNADVIANMKTVADLIMCGVENRKIDDYE